MKSNIDLTENEMFSRPIHEVKDDYDLSPEYQPVLTGNKEERELKQLFLEENSGNHCDCCGGISSCNSVG